MAMAMATLAAPKAAAWAATDGRSTKPAKATAPTSSATPASRSRHPVRLPWWRSPNRLPTMMPTTIPVPPTPPAMPPAADSSRPCTSSK